MCCPCECWSLQPFRCLRLFVFYRTGPIHVISMQPLVGLVAQIAGKQRSQHGDKVVHLYEREPFSGPLLDPNLCSHAQKYWEH